MQLPQILFVAFGVITLGAALVVVTRRDLLHASWALVISCVGVAGILALLEAPLIAALQLLVCAGGIAALIKLNPLPSGVARSDTLGVNRRWWMAVLATAALCGILGWVAFGHGHDSPPPGDVVALGAAPLDLSGSILPLATAAVSLSVAVVGAVMIARRR
jgi:NADH:ubiquinone oxidoreductase subunit 6 (subunit J)